MIKILKNIDQKEYKGFMNFFLTGVFGATVNFLSQIPLKAWFLDFGLNDDQAFAWSIFVAYMIATAASFVPAKLYAFSAKSSGNTKREWIKFFLIATVALGVQELVSIWTLNGIAHPYFSEFSLFIREKGSHIVGMGFSFLANFFGHRFFTFRTTGLYNKLRPQNQ